MINILLAYFRGIDALIILHVELVDVENEYHVVFNRLEALIDEWHEIEGRFHSVGRRWFEKGESQLLVRIFSRRLLSALGIEDFILIWRPLVVFDVLELNLFEAIPRLENGDLVVLFDEGLSEFT